MAKVFETLRFGKLEILEQDIIRFADGLLGFAEDKRFVVLEDPSQAPFQWLQCLDNTDLSFVLVDPLVIKPDYKIQVPREEVRDLELKKPEDARIYVICVVPDEIHRSTANLKGPIVINPSNRRAKQLVILEDKYPTRYEFLREMQVQEDSRNQK